MKRELAEILYLKDNDDKAYYRLMVYGKKLYVNNAAVLIGDVDSVSCSGNMVIVQLRDGNNVGVNCRSEEHRDNAEKFLNKILKL